MSKLPLVSIIITSYNRAGTVGRAIESALAQDYQNLEIIITDNCSTDNSEEVIKNYISDPRIKYNRNTSNIGMLGNFHKAIDELAIGKYFAIVNSDDYLICESFISKAMKMANSYPDVFVIKGKYKTWHKKTNDFSTSKYNVVQEFYNGREWLRDSANIEFEALINVLGWGAIIIDRDEFLKLENLGFPIVQADVHTSILLLLKGNICFIDEYVLMFQFLNDRLPTYSDDQDMVCKSMLNVTRQITEHEYYKLPGADMKQFFDRYFLYIIDHYMRILYSYNRLKFNEFKKYLITEYNCFYEEIAKSKSWRLYSVVYYNTLVVKCIRTIKALNFKAI